MHQTTEKYHRQTNWSDNVAAPDLIWVVDKTKWAKLSGPSEVLTHVSSHPNPLLKNDVIILIR